MTRPTDTNSGEMPMQNRVSDPVTGTKPVGPVTGRGGTGGWGIAARWIGLFLLFAFLALGLYWFM